MGADGRLVNYIDESTLKHDKGVGREILIETYTGLRPGSAAGLRYKPSDEDGWIDVDTGTIHRTGNAEGVTKKSKFPTSSIPRRLRQHVGRWRKRDRSLGLANYIIRKWDTTPYFSTGFAFNKIVENAGLDPNIIRHTFRHTLASWLAYIGAEQASAAKLLGMSVGTLDRVYRHLAPATEENAINKLADPVCRARLRTLTRPPTSGPAPSPAKKGRKGPKGLRHNPVAAPPRARRLLGRIRKARASDAGALR
jgi:integrase